MAGYLGSVPVPQATQHRESFTCTEGQTSFATAGYTAQFVDVYLNGSHLSPADFTATNGSDVVLGVAASADDVCDIISYTPFEVASPVFTGSATFNEGSADADFRVESNGNANMLFVDGGNNAVVIGHNDVVNIATISPSLQIEGTGFAGSAVGQYRYSADAFGPTILFASSRNASIAGQTILQNNDELGKLRFYGSDGNDFENYGAEIIAAVDGTPGSNDMPGRLVFSTTADNSASPTERLRIDSSGRLGIGVTPSAYGSSVKVVQLANAAVYGIGQNAYLAANNYFDGSNNRYIATDEASRLYQAAGAFVFESAASGSAGAAITFSEKMRVAANGNVGINIASPLDLLHLNDPNDDCVLNLDTAVADKNSIIKFSDPDAQGKAFIQYAHSNDVLRFNLSGSEKFKIAGTGLTDFFSSTTAIRIRTGGTGTNTQILSGANGASNIDDGTESIVIYASGNIQNTNNSYGSLSDEKIKENIVDATDKLNDIKKVRIRNFNIIGHSTKQIGVVAQELETVFPGLVDTIKDMDYDAVDEDDNNAPKELGTETKSVKYSVFVPILIKAMQEQQALIETLTDRITALEG